MEGKSINLDEKTIEKVAKFLDESNLIADFKTFPIEKIKETLADPNHNIGVAGAYKDARFLAENRLPVKPEHVLDWQKKLTDEQIKYDRPLSNAYRGHLRDCSMRVRNRIIQAPTMDAFVAILDDMNDNLKGLGSKPALNAILSYAAKTHIDFLELHPFYDGSGRVARILSNYMIEYFGYPVLIFSNHDRNLYFHAITERTNKLDFRKISEYFLFKHESSEDYKARERQLNNMKQMYKKQSTGSGKKSFWRKLFGME